MNNNPTPKPNGISNRTPLSSLTNKLINSNPTNTELNKNAQKPPPQTISQINNYDTVCEETSSEILPLISLTSNENCLSSASEVTNQSLNDTLTHTVLSNCSTTTENSNSTSSNSAKNGQKSKKRWVFLFEIFYFL